jgi:hypothetical protein
MYSIHTTKIWYIHTHILCMHTFMHAYMHACQQNAHSRKGSESSCGKGCQYRKVANTHHIHVYFYSISESTQQHSVTHSLPHSRLRPSRRRARWPCLVFHQRVPDQHWSPARGTPRVTRGCDRRQCSARRCTRSTKTRHTPECATYATRQSAQRQSAPELEPLPRAASLPRLSSFPGPHYIQPIQPIYSLYAAYIQPIYSLYICSLQTIGCV